MLSQISQTLNGDEDHIKKWNRNFKGKIIPDLDLKASFPFSPQLLSNLIDNISTATNPTFILRLSITTD